jgi:hypothetical protein
MKPFPSELLKGTVSNPAYRLPAGRQGQAGVSCLNSELFIPFGYILKNFPTFKEL